MCAGVVVLSSQNKKGTNGPSLLETTGLIFMIQKPHESHLVTDRQWLGHSQQEAKGPDSL